MKKRLMDFLCCPECLGELHLEVTLLKGGDIIEGLLKCPCGKNYPIKKGVPRMLDFSQNTDKEVRGVLQTKKSFQQEWSYFDYSDRNWGLDVEERKRIFLEEMCVDANSLENKTLLDAGCGNGTLTVGLGDFGLEVVGMDLTDVVERAKEYNTNPNVHFVQGNILKPPFKNGSFNLLYSCGVIHHTPNPHKAFKQLSKLVGNRGKISVWVYRKDRKRKGVEYRIARFVSRITSRLPLPIQDLIYLSLAFTFEIKQKILLFLNPGKKGAKTWSERMVWFYDAFSQRHQSFHSQEEVFNWFEEEGLSNIELTRDEELSFSVCGDKGEMSVKIEEASGEK